MKEKNKASARKLKETAQVYNNLFENFNELKSVTDDKGNKNVRLKKKLEELEAVHSAWEVQLKEAQSKPEYYKNKSTSIRLSTIVKIRAKMLKDYTEGKMSTWDLEVAFLAWEKMKVLYSDSEGEEDHQVVKQAGPSEK